VKLELYYAPKTCALVPYATLTEAGADFTVHNMNSRSGALKTPEYLRLNPKHKVPVLVIDGEPLTENVAIQIFNPPHVSTNETAAAGPEAGDQGHLADGLVCFHHPPAPDAQRAPRKLLRPAGLCRCRQTRRQQTVV